ncbi:aldose reductase-related protein 1-like [Notothenia coriiceps]|uniref:Aldose reductase-related protein 1-like n=1 Tax=Notothenia coriiceps TaxID=8208 RepID=A0A6I9P3W9_9TELE|nr:PREDICTED: aldose reductase-related protein 1-like [Notothenia coriiceps]
MFSSSHSVLLKTGVQMPLLGLGTYKLVSPEDVSRAVDAALLAGYRAFDSAAVYLNEAELGRALKQLLPKHGLTREDVFITSKLGSKDQGKRAMEGALHSLSDLDMGYIDLYLIHWPGTQDLEITDPRNSGKEFIFMLLKTADGKTDLFSVDESRTVAINVFSKKDCKGPRQII